jgi:kumamolisin
VGVISRPVRAGTVAIMGLAITAFTGTLASAGAATPAPGANLGYVALANSVPKTTDNVTGSYSSSKMQIEVAVAPRDEAGLNTMLAALYDKNSPSYHHWLTSGQFDARYGPTPAARAAVAKFLSGSGLSVVPSGSPYLVRATGSSAQIQRTFHTQLNTFKDPKGTKYFANSTPVYMPSSLAGTSLGVIGLTNTVRNAVHANHFRNTLRRPAKASSTSGCETGYPTKQQLFAFYDNGTNFPSGYGAGPGCSGLTPSQENSLYGAPNLGARGKGKGVDIAVFELSAYLHSDIATYTHQFYGPGYNPPLVDVNIDGGPLAPQCPTGDMCPPDFNGYAGDIEVVADIETQLAIAPDVSHLIVYNAPNDFTGQTELDEWSAIAKANVADSVSSSWAVCENDITAGYAQAENTIFRQMAAQGQSVFGAEGDTGAFSCIRSDGTTIPNLLDPPAQPWVTSVGGTSFENFNPGTNPHPSYPRVGEAVWNVQNLCSNAAPSAANDNRGGFFWCQATGAAGGGSSQYWGMPSYQKGPGVINSGTTVGNGTTQCSLAKIGTPCREAPDISANADEFTPYAEYCTGNANTPNSVCGTFSASQPVPGWFGIGGTSLSSPLVSAIVADRDSLHGNRAGNINRALYREYQIAPSLFFHDVTGAGHIAKNNGLFPAVRGYDLATGIGTIKMAPFIIGSF